jgi:hypothetical protein
MINEQREEQASLYVLGALTGAEQRGFEAELRRDAELRELVQGLRRAAELLALSVPAVAPPPGLRDKVLQRIDAASATAVAGATAGAPAPGFRFVGASGGEGWKPLPVAGAWTKVLSIDRDRGYVVLLGRLEAGVRYPAHVHAGPEDLYLLTGDLHLGDRLLRPGDFHHSDAGTSHGENFSVEGCTLLAVLSLEHDLAKFAMA